MLNKDSALSDVSLVLAGLFFFFIPLFVFGLSPQSVLFSLIITWLAVFIVKCIQYDFSY